MRLWVIAVVLLIPASSAAPVDLYMHLAGFQDMPVNTQQPQTEDWTRRGLVGSGCVPVPGVEATSRGSHTWYAFGSPGIVAYDGDGEARIHAERGLATDVEIDPLVQPVLTWNLLAMGPAAGMEQRPQVVPEVVLRVQVRASDDISIRHEAFDAGPLVADGQVGPVTLRPGLDHEAVTMHEVDGLAVYAFEVPLTIHNTTISERDGYNIRIDAMLDNPYCMESSQGGYVMPDLVTPYQGHGQWNKLHIGIENPLALQSLHIQFIKGHLVAHASAMSPFGAFDVDTGPGPHVVGPMDLQVEAIPPAPRYHEHGSRELFEHTQTWIINTTGAENGLYTLALTMMNRQGTANVTGTATFEVGDHALRICQAKGVGRECVIHRTADSVDVPAPPLAWLLGAVVVGRRWLQAAR